MRADAAALVLLLASLPGTLALRRAWIDRNRVRSHLRLAGWLTLLVTTILAAVLVGPMLGIAVAIASVPIGALCIVAGNATRRATRALRAGQVAPEPLEGRSRAWRGWLKVLLAGPLGMFAAMGLAFCYAAWAPGAVQTRLLIAALLVPALWGLAMTWTLADQRLIRSGAMLSGTVVVSFGLAFLGGIA